MSERLKRVSPMKLDASMTDLSPFITDPAELGDILHLPKQIVTEAIDVCSSTPLCLPRRLTALIEPNNPNDPILLQFWPKKEEKDRHPGYVEDPLCEWSKDTCTEYPSLPKGILQKYSGRVLVTTNGSCAAKCRFCFRRHSPKTTEIDWNEIACFLERNPAVTELILSGGDPLGNSDTEIESSLYYIKGLSFVKRVRIHTRYPILIPERITDSLLNLFNGLLETEKKLVIVFHLNHPAEINSETIKIFRKLTSLGIILLSQTVLLRGINDDPQILSELFQKEFEGGVLPYYLHQLDHVAGAAHFEVPADRGLTIFTSLRNSLPGYLVPRYVREIPGAPSKLPVIS